VPNRKQCAKLTNAYASDQELPKWKWAEHVKKETLCVLAVDTANSMVGPVKNIKHSLLC
jgi:hypothetical protein